MTLAETPEGLSWSQKMVVLVTAFLAWMFAGLQIALFPLIHRAIFEGLGAAPSASSPSGIDEAIVRQWFAWYQAAFLLGGAAGGWIFGILGDRIGRTKSLAFSVLCYSLFTGACYFATSPTQLLVLRFLACLGIGGAWPNTVALVAEAWPDASRPFLAGVLGTAANFGQVFMGVLGLWKDVTPDSWRWTFIAAATPAIIGFWCLIGVPESIRWRASRKPGATQGPGPLNELFRPPLLSRTMIGILLGAIPVIGTAANAQWIVPWTDQVQTKLRAEQLATADRTPDQPAPARSKPDPKSKAWTVISRSSGAAVGSLIGGILATILGRRFTYFLISLLTLVTSCLIFGYMNPLHPWFQWAAFAFGLVGVVYFGWLPLYLPELFPTRVRASGTGISFNSGRAVAAVVVLGTGVMLQWFGGDYAKIGWWTGMIYAVGMFVILFAPRTDAKSLQD